MVGVNVGDDGFWSLEAGGLILPRRAINYVNAGRSNGTPLLTIPFLDAATGQQASLDISSQDIDFNPFLVGSIAIHSDLQVWGLEANAIAHSIRTAERFVDVFAGVRTLNLNENLTINQFISPTQTGNITIQYPAVGQGAGDYYAVVAGGLVNVTDSFATANLFYGTQLGGRFRWDYGSVSAALSGKVAFGITHQQATINGSSSATAAINPNTGAVVPNVTTPGGVFALQNNIGSYGRIRSRSCPSLASTSRGRPRPGCACTSATACCTGATWRAPARNRFDAQLEAGADRRPAADQHPPHRRLHPRCGTGPALLHLPRHHFLGPGSASGGRNSLLRLPGGRQTWPRPAPQTSADRSAWPLSSGGWR